MSSIMQVTEYAVINQNPLVPPMFLTTSLLQARIVQAHYPESYVIDTVNDAIVPEHQIFDGRSHEFSSYIYRMDDYLNWTQCFNDVARWN